MVMKIYDYVFYSNWLDPRVIFPINEKDCIWLFWCNLQVGHLLEQYVI